MVFKQSVITHSMNIKPSAIIAVTIITFSFIALSIYVVSQPVNETDILVSHFIQGEGSGFLDRLATTLSLPGKITFSVILVLFTTLYLFYKKFKVWAFLLLFTPGVLLPGYLIKMLIARPRPTSLLVRVSELNTDGSYPSGTVLFCTVFFGFLTVFVNKNIKGYWKNIWIVILFFLIVLTSWARIYLGAHWFTDTLGGQLAGLLCLFLLVHFHNKNQAKNHKK